MSILSVREHLEARDIFHSEVTISGYPTIVGYEKQFRWTWFATQLNCFIFSVDCGGETVEVDTFERLFEESFRYAQSHYRGWPRGLQSGLGVVLLLSGHTVSPAAQEYCTQLKPSKKWAGFSVPLAKSTSDGERYFFEKRPAWGRIYYGYFEQLSRALLSLRESA